MIADPPDGLERADVERVVRAAVPRAFALELAVGFLVALRLLERGHLRFRLHQPVLCLLRFERPQPCGVPLVFVQITRLISRDTPLV